MRSMLAVLGLNALGISFLRSLLMQPNLSPTSRVSGDTLLLTLPNAIDPILEQFETQSFPTREEKAKAIQAALTAATAEWHSPVLTLLKPLNVETESFWVANKILVRGSNPLIEDAILTFDPAIKILKNFEVPLVLPVDVVNLGKKPDGPVWGVSKIGAPEAWKSGFNGTGVNVGSIDTGVNKKHEALEGNFLGPTGWFNPAEAIQTGIPIDTHGHGTHTMGTICGTHGIGVAPGATWTSCLGCTGASCPGQYLLTCGQWYAKAENLVSVVSNSWGGDGGNIWYNDVIKVWRANGIVPVFAAGNSGPDCVTTGSPGDQVLFSVGATDINDFATNFSSRGPEKGNTARVVPQISAPGNDILSAWNADDHGYQTMSGTSMATPHVSGAIAVLKSKNANLTEKELADILFGSANKQLGRTGSSCGNIQDDSFPNNVYGNGRLNLAAALSQVSRSK